jgi:serine/threonine-protein kinase RsbW
MPTAIPAHARGGDAAPTLRWHGAATPEAVGTVRRLTIGLAARLGAAAELRDRLGLAVTEAMSNVVVHAYRDAAAPGAVHVVAEHDPERLRIVIRDHGLGLVPRADSPGLGLGLGLMAQAADALQVLTAPAGGGVEVRLEFAL